MTSKNRSFDEKNNSISKIIYIYVKSSNNNYNNSQNNNNDDNDYDDGNNGDDDDVDGLFLATQNRKK
eukprot:Awhi_evm1s6681